MYPLPELVEGIFTSLGFRLRGQVIRHSHDSLLLMRHWIRRFSIGCEQIKPDTGYSYELTFANASLDSDWAAFSIGPINYLDRGSLSVALPFVGRDLHLDPLQQGWALAAFSITYTLAQLPAGWLVDRWPLKWLYAGAFALWCLASAATGLASDLFMLIFFRLLLGIGESVYVPGGLRFISEQFGPTERSIPTAIFDVGCKMGLAIGLVIEAWILRDFGWRWMFLSTGLAGLLWLLPWLLLYPTPAHSVRVPRAVMPRKALMSIVRNRNAWGMAA